MKVMTAIGPIDCTLAAGADPSIFNCRVCGVPCPITPADGSGAICAEHCEDHDYEYVRGEGGKHCRHCYAPEPEDWR